jgi:DNA-binding NtrC family response regulator
MRSHTKEPEVLLIEEDEHIRESLSDMLTERGYAAVAVRTPASGMVLLERGFRPRVILIDPFTPNGAAGFKEQLAANPALLGMPLILGPRGRSPERQIERTLPREHHLAAPLDVHEILKLVHGYCRPWG